MNWSLSVRSLLVPSLLCAVTLLTPGNPEVARAGNGPLYHVLSTGQSNGLGFDGAPCLSDTQPFNNLMLQATFDGEIKAPGFIPLTECYFTDHPQQTLVETPNSAIGNTITNLVGVPDFQMIVTHHGRQGTPYDGLKKGTTPYHIGLAQVREAKRAAESLGRSYSVAALSIIHGESDSGNGPVLYQQHLEEWYRDYNDDVHAITGQVDDIPIFTDQMSVGRAFVELGQLKAAEENPGKIYLVGPKYFLKRAPSALHLNSLSYRLLGEYHGKAIKKVLVDKQPWIPLSPKEVTRTGNVISLRLNVPAPPIVLDTALVMPQTNHGFEYIDDGPTPSIVDARITGPDSIEIVLSGTPTGSNPRLRYAFTAFDGREVGPDKAGSPRGNIRDSDSSPSLYDSNLYNWLVQFEKPVVVKPTPAPSATPTSL